MKTKHRIIIYGISILLIVIQVLPYVIAETYTFPLQDDYIYTRALFIKMYSIDKGKIISSILLAIEGYTNFRGYYFSMFLIYLTDGITHCNIEYVRIFHTLTLIIHYIALAGLTYTASTKVMKLSKETATVITPIFMTCFTCLFYFVNNETLFWLCAVAVYLIPCTLVYIYATIYILGINKESKACCLTCVILGILVGGASINVAFLACVFICQLMYWGCYVCKKTKYSLISGLPLLAGCIVNILAPGNFRAKTGQKIYSGLIEILKGSFDYEFRRIKMFVCEYPLFMIVIIILIILLLSSDQRCTYKFPVPLIYTALLIFGEISTIFPTQWASGVKSYEVYERCIIISDWASFWMIFLILFYWVGWIKTKIGPRGIPENGKKAVIYIFLLLALATVMISQKDKNASYRLASELKDERVQKYCNWVESIIHEVEKSSDEIVEIHAKEVVDDTCMASAYFNMGIYDPDEYVGNSAMGIYYDKKAIYIIEEDNYGISDN